MIGIRVWVDMTDFFRDLVTSESNIYYFSGGTAVQRAALRFTSAIFLIRIEIECVPGFPKITKILERNPLSADTRNMYILKLTGNIDVEVNSFLYVLASPRLSMSRLTIGSDQLVSC